MQLTRYRLSDASHIFVLGVGAAYASLIELFKANERFTENISKVFFFVSDQTLVACRSATDESLSYWYYDNSTVFVAEDHQIWEYTQRKPKKRFGSLFRSPYEDIQEMLHHHKAQVTEEMLCLTQAWQEPKDVASSEDELSPNHKEPGRMGTNVLGSPVRFPPVGNFALSPRGRTSPGRRP